MARGNPNKSLGQQFTDIMKPRVKGKGFKNIIKSVAKTMELQIKERTRRGRPLPNGGRWDTPYNERYARRHNKETVNLRLTGRSMNNLRGTTRGGRIAEIRGNDLLRAHNDGDVRGGKRRQIVPESKQQVPRQMRSMIKYKIEELLKGNATK